MNIIFQFGNAVSFNFYKVAGGSMVVGSCNGRNVNSRPLYHLYWGITMDISCLNQFFNEFYRIQFPNLRLNNSTQILDGFQSKKC